MYIYICMCNFIWYMHIKASRFYIVYVRAYIYIYLCFLDFFGCCWVYVPISVLLTHAFCIGSTCFQVCPCTGGEIGSGSTGILLRVVGEKGDDLSENHGLWMFMDGSGRCFKLERTFYCFRTNNPNRRTGWKKQRQESIMFIITTRGLVKMFPETNLFIFASHNCGQQLWTNRFWHTLFHTNPDDAFQGPPWQWVGHTHTRAHATHHGGWGPFGGHSFLTVALSCLNANPMRKIWSGYYFEFKTCLFDCDHAQPQWLGTARSAFRHYHKFLSASSEFCHLYGGKVT